MKKSKDKGINGKGKRVKKVVIPAQAGIHCAAGKMLKYISCNPLLVVDSRLRGNDKCYIIPLLLAAIILAAIFLKFPQIDLFISGLFYKQGGRFYLNENPVLMFLHNSVTYITIFMAILWVGVIIATSIKKRKVFGLSRLRAIYLLLALIIGPGLVVNTVFKDHWGRARPHQIEMFGGKAQFTPAFVLSNQCDVNCSFVSGDPSVGFYFLALALAIPAARKFFTIFGLGFGTLLAATRVMQGAHFLSDVIFSGIFTFVTVYLLYLVLLKFEAKQQ